MFRDDFQKFKTIAKLVLRVINVIDILNELYFILPFENGTVHSIKVNTFKYLFPSITSLLKTNFPTVYCLKHSFK